MQIIWGSTFWLLMHSITGLFPDNPSQLDTIMMTLFFDSYRDLLPCIGCKKHYSENMDVFPLNTFMVSNRNMIAGGVAVHNIVNVMLRKKLLFDGSDESINRAVLKYNIKSNKMNIKTLLANTITYAIEGYGNINDKMANGFKKLFESVSHFLLYKNINLYANMKHINIVFNSKMTLEKMVKNLIFST